MMTASITLIIGPMGSGKSHKMLSYARKKLFGNARLVFISPVRADRKFYSRTGLTLPDGVQIICAENILGCLCDIETIENDRQTVVIIDEGHFFHDLMDGCLKLRGLGYDVSVGALNGSRIDNGSTEMFKSVADLLPHVNNVKFCKSYCVRCRTNDGIYHNKIGGSSSLLEKGGQELYEVLCEPCLSSIVQQTTGKVDN